MEDVQNIILNRILKRPEWMKTLILIIDEIMVYCPGFEALVMNGIALAMLLIIIM